MKPGSFTLVLYRGDTARWRFRLWEDVDKTVPVDLLGVTALAEIRDLNNEVVLAPMACEVVLPNFIDMTLRSEDAQLLPTYGGCDAPTGPIGMWDMELTYVGGDVMTLLYGPVKVTADVTRPEPTLYTVAP